MTESFQNYLIEVQGSICSLDNIYNHLNEYIDNTPVYDQFFHVVAFCDFYRTRPFLNGHLGNVKARAVFRMRASLTAGDRSVGPCWRRTR